jgi:hypothetical protein
MCKELLVILVNRMVDKKRIIGKDGGTRRRRAQGVADPKRGRNVKVIWVVFTKQTSKNIFLFIFN